MVYLMMWVDGVGSLVLFGHVTGVPLLLWVMSTTLCPSCPALAAVYAQ
jgi:hypothetical protein